MNLIKDFWKFPEELDVPNLGLDKEYNHILLEKYLEFKRPFFTRFPFPYHKVPVKLRNVFFSLSKRKLDRTDFPNWPIDDSLEKIKNQYINQLDEGISCRNFWPKKKDFCICITHDIETSSGFDNIEKFRKIERDYGIKSGWSIVAKRYKIDYNKLKELGEEGCEIISHGYNHDGKLPFLKDRKIRKRLEYAKRKINVKGFRSPQLQRTYRFFNILEDYFEYDLSVPDTEILSPICVRNGSCSIFPYFIGNLLEIPLTMPQDFMLMHALKMKDKEILELWKEKLEYIKKNKGLVLFNIHPDDYIFGGKLELYKELLEYLSKQKNAWFGLPNEIAEHWKKRTLN